MLLRLKATVPGRRHSSFLVMQRGLRATDAVHRWDPNAPWAGLPTGQSGSRAGGMQPVQQTPIRLRLVFMCLMEFTYLPASGKIRGSVAVPVGCQLTVSTSLVPTQLPQRQWEKSPVSPWSEGGRPGETDFPHILERVCQRIPSRHVHLSYWQEQYQSPGYKCVLHGVSRTDCLQNCIHPN